MTTISLNDAIRIVELHLNEVVRNAYDSPPGDSWVVTKANIQEHGDYWLMPYQSKLYWDTENPSYLLAGNHPLKISKSGNVLGFGSDSVE